MFAVCYDNQKQRYKVMRLSKTQKCEFIEICSVHNTYWQAEIAAVRLSRKDEGYDIWWAKKKK